MIRLSRYIKTQDDSSSDYRPFVMIEMIIIDVIESHFSGHYCILRWTDAILKQCQP